MKPEVIFQNFNRNQIVFYANAIIGKDILYIHKSHNWYIDLNPNIYLFTIIAIKPDQFDFLKKRFVLKFLG